MKRLKYGFQQIYQSAIDCKLAGQLLCLIFVVSDTDGSTVPPAPAATLSAAHPYPSRQDHMLQTYDHLIYQSVKSSSSSYFYLCYLSSNETKLHFSL